VKRQADLLQAPMPMPMSMISKEMRWEK